MVKTLFGGGSGSANDVESLLTLHGVLCAFLVSLSIGFEANLAAASTERMNFFGALAKEPSFREWIVYVVDNKYNQSHETGAPSRPFAWNLTVASGIWVDLKQEMLHGFLARQLASNLECANDGCKLNDIVWLDDPWLSTATSALYPEMDMQFMETWFLHNPKACELSKSNRPPRNWHAHPHPHPPRTQTAGTSMGPNARLGPRHSSSQASSRTSCCTSAGC